MKRVRVDMSRVTDLDDDPLSTLGIGKDKYLWDDMDDDDMREKREADITDELTRRMIQ